MRRAGGNRQTRRHHAIGPEHADRKVSDVHRAAFAAIEAIGLAIQLAHHAGQVSAFGQGVAVPPVGGGEVIAGAQMGAHAHGHRLLAGGQVQRAAHLGAAIGGFVVGADAALAQYFSRIFKGADARHLGVELSQQGDSGGV